MKKIPHRLFHERKYTNRNISHSSLNQISGEFNGVMLNATSMNMN